MLYNQIFATLALATLSGAAAVSSPKVLQLPFTREHRASNATVPKSLGKRDDPTASLTNRHWYYTTNIKLGSQGTEVAVDIDTGSADLWVDSSAFDTSESSTWDDLGTQFAIGYGDGSEATGTFGKDTVEIGGATLSGAQFAVATYDTAGTFILGVGLETVESSVSYNTNDNTISNTYTNIPAALKEQGIVESNAYSLWLDDFDADSGSILFGGVDHTKYTGTLATLPFIPTYEEIAANEYFRPDIPDRFIVTLNGIALSNSAGKSGDVVTDASLPVLLDSGTTVTYLPKDWVDAIAAATGATYNSNYEAYILPNGKIDGSINYNFAGVEIKVPFASFLRPIYYTDGSVATDSNGNTIWSIGALPGSTTSGVDLEKTIYILGDTFLSGAYVVFDLDNLEVAIAEAATGTITSSDIEAIGTGGIPSATQAPSYSSTSTNTNYSLQTPSGLF